MQSVCGVSVRRRQAFSTELSPPNWPIYAPEPRRSEILLGTFDALAEILPALGSCDIKAWSDVIVRGGPIVAWGETDIDDPGKLTMAPFFAAECARRILPPRSKFYWDRRPSPNLADTTRSDPDR